MPIWELVRLIGRAIPQTFANMDFLTVMVIVLLLIYGQYRRISVLEAHILGSSCTNPVVETATAVLYGLVGGILASAVFIGVGIPLSETGIWYVWPLALLLMLFHPRFLCFSYAGGILAIIYLIFGRPTLNVSATMALVAVLHMVEAALIRLHGHVTPSPVYLRSDGGEVVGGLSLQKFWPLPILALVLVTVSGDLEGADLVAMPDWWPLIKPYRLPGEGERFLYLLFPMVAALGYGDICLSRLPKEKARLSSLYLASYSLLLLGTAIGAASVPALRWVAALGAPLGHELVIYLGRQSEKVNPPLFRSTQGAMVLAVQPGSPGQTMGLVPGDIIVAINDYPVFSQENVRQVMNPWVIDPTIAVKGSISGKGDRLVHYKGKIPPLGVVFVPDPYEKRALILRNEGFVARWLKRRRHR
ncbi:MAG: PDZ domain-containing protein [Firmicutes bacterium]|nr:PDZ domain-containing protein [Bacillota bacterium]